jgi:hypothetical protein
MSKVEDGSVIVKHQDKVWGPTQPHIQLVPGVLSPAVKQPVMTVTTWLHLVLR